jgi:23S rRNA-/tRNA-specific pseudouridylate synthase
VAAPAVHDAHLRARGPRVTVRVEPFEGGLPIRTELVRAEPAGDFTLIEAKAPFARRHQLRAHLSALGHPLAGDTLYGGPALPDLERHYLHASELRFAHPHTGDPLQLRSALPQALHAVLERL